MDERIVEQVARAIRDAENGIDGDTVGDMLYEDFRIEGNADECRAQLLVVCRAAARAAIGAMPPPRPAQTKKPRRPCREAETAGQWMEDNDA